MLKQITGGFVIAIAASLVTLYFAGSAAELDDAAIDKLVEKLVATEAMQAEFRPRPISFSEPSEQDSWLRGTATGGELRPGPAVDEKPLADSANAVCFLSKVEFEGVTPGNNAGCYVSVDEFTGWWQINAEQGEGSTASVSCNARCVVWE